MAYSAEKTQFIRLVDVFALGPFMIWAGMQHLPKGARGLMVVSGIATILFNAQNYIDNERGLK